VNLYLDTSSLVKLYFQEEYSNLVKEAVEKSKVVATSRISYVEAKAAFARKYRNKGLGRKDYQRLLFEFEKDWGNYLIVEILEEVISLAGGLVEKYDLRAYDALHLSSALTLQSKSGLKISFSSFDKQQERVAKKEGLSSLF